MNSIKRAIGGLVLAVAFLTTATAADAAAQTPKNYTVNISPSEATSSTRQAFDVKITNRSNAQKLGSANLTAPEPFGLISAAVPRGTATIDGRVVQLRNLNLEPGRSVTVSVVADTSCATGDWAWSILTKQANDFNGTGNDFNLDETRSSLITSVIGADSKCVKDCPEEAVGADTTCRAQVVHRGITTITYTPTGDPGGVGEVQTSSKSSLSLSSTSTGTVTVTTPYTLVFDVAAHPALIGNAGQLQIDVRQSGGIDCTDIAERVPVSGVTNFATGQATPQSPRRKTVTWDITYDKAMPGRPAPAAMCFGAPYPFLTLSPQLGSGDSQFIGSLPDCGAANALRGVTACTFTRRAVSDIRDVIQSDIPGVLTDPYYRG